MKNKLSLFIIILGLLITAGCGSSDNKSTNNLDVIEAQSNNEVEDQIISTTVALVEIMDELDLDLAGVPTSYKELPDRYSDAKEVGMAMEPDMEIIRSLKPTDVLSVSTLKSDLEDSFTRSDTPVTFVDLESVEGMYDSILDLGEKYDRTEQAEGIVNDFEEKLSETQEKTKDKESPTVLILLGVPGSYLVATEHSYVGDLVKRVGGENAIQGETVEFISSNTENLQQANADIILRMSHGMPEAVVEMFDKDFEENDVWKHFKAVKNNRVYDLEETRFGTTANLAASEALEELVGMLYPEESK